MLVPLLWLIATLLPMLFLNRWLSRHIQGVGLLVSGRNEIALIVYFLALLPGIVAHELSHWLMAHLLGMKTGKITIGPSKAAGGKVRLGSVTVSRADPLRESLVGLAPLLAGSGLILLIGSFVFDLRALSQAFILQDAGWFFDLIASSVRVPDFWLWLYLIFALSNAMLPSEADRRAWVPLGIFLGVMTALLIVVGWTPQIPPAAVDSIIGGVDYLALAFAITLAIDLVFVGIVAGLEWLLSFLTGTHIKYS